MSYKNRYVFIKRTYPNTIVIFRDKHNKYVSYSDDSKLLEYLNFTKLNDLNKLKIDYIVVSNMMILEHKTFNEKNKYILYWERFNLFKLVNYIRQRRR